MQKIWLGSPNRQWRGDFTPPSQKCPAPLVCIRTLELSPQLLLEEINGYIDRLGGLLQQLKKEESESNHAVARKQEAIDLHDYSFPRCAMMAQAFLELAEEPELARRVRSSRRFPGRTADFVRTPRDPDEPEVPTPEPEPNPEPDPDEPETDDGKETTDS